MKKMIAPSMMCCDFVRLGGQLDIFAREGIEYLHIDVMDGSFVPNYALGVDYVKKLRGASDIPLDLHLMVERPEDKLAWFTPQRGDIVSVHAEATCHLQRTLQEIKKCGALAFVALNLATPLSALDYVLDDIDGVVLMTVNPGFAGQRLIPQCLAKIADLRAYLAAHGKGEALIEADGNVSFANIPAMRDAGADIFVGGTSSVFSGDLTESIGKVRELLIKTAL